MKPSRSFGVALRLHQWGAVPDTREGYSGDACSQKCRCFLCAFSDDDGERAGLTEHPRSKNVGLIAQPEDAALLIKRVFVFDRLAFIVDTGESGLKQPQVDCVFHLFVVMSGEHHQPPSAACS